MNLSKGEHDELATCLASLALFDGNVRNQISFDLIFLMLFAVK